MNQEEKETIYPDKRKDLERAITKLNNSSLSKDNKELITEYSSFISSQGTGNSRRSKVMNMFRIICESYNYNLKQPVKKNLVKVFAQIQDDNTRLVRNSKYTAWTVINRPRSEATKKDYKITLKQFYNWYEEEDPRVYGTEIERIESLKAYKYLGRLKLPVFKKELRKSELITQQDVVKALSVKTTTRNKALLSLFYESGARAGEILTMRIRDITVFNGFADVTFPKGKTGTRTIAQTFCIPYLTRWLEEHPFKQEPDCSLWVKQEARRSPTRKPLNWVGCSSVIKKMFIIANIPKRYNLHWFRHSRATALSGLFKESELRQYFGWTNNSTMPGTYIHLDGREARNKYLELKGLKEPDQLELEKHNVCGCGEINTLGMDYCGRCGKPLSVKVVLNAQKEIIEAEIETEKIGEDIKTKPAQIELLKQFLNGLSKEERRVILEG
jgi:integrase